MRRSHRIAHRRLWPILGLVLAFGVALALALCPPPEPAPQAAAGDVR